MIRPVGLFDIPLISKLQHQGVQLDLKRALTQPETPLAVVLRAPLSFGQPTALTYIGRQETDSSHQTGFIQLRCRPGERPQADITYIAPTLVSNESAGELWTELLNIACWEAGIYGVQQVFADLPADSDMVTPFLNAGFMIFAREELLECRQLNISDPPEAISLRSQNDTDILALQRLYAAIVPMGVKQAEGILGISNPLQGKLFTRDGTECYVLEFEGEIVGHLEVTRGKIGHHIRFAILPEKAAIADTIIEAGLQLLKDSDEYPIYTRVRTYQGFLRPALTNKGFKTIDRRDLAVRQTLARNGRPVISGVKVLEPRPEVSVTPTFSPHCTAGKRVANG